MRDKDRHLCEAYVRFAEFYNASGLPPLNMQEGVFIVKIHEKKRKWLIAINGHEQHHRYKAENIRINCEPFYLQAHIDGLLTLIINPYGGTGLLGCEDKFISLMEKLKREKIKLIHSGQTIQIS